MFGIVIGVLIFAVIIVPIFVFYHLDYGLPFTRKRKLVKHTRRVYELEWEMNIGGVRQWKVKKSWEGDWVAVGPHPYIKGHFENEHFDKWSDAFSYAQKRSRRCAYSIPRELA